MIRLASVWTALLAPCVGAHFAMTMACEWWPIMSVMKRASAGVYTRRTLSARAAMSESYLAALGVDSTLFCASAGEATAQSAPHAVMAAVTSAAAVERGDDGIAISAPSGYPRATGRVWRGLHSIERRTRGW